eukprot:m51a1_g6111 hypothetical protein (164) ;mRNA; r:94472-95028
MAAAEKVMQLVQGIEEELRVFRDHLCDPGTAPVDYVSLVVVNSEALKFLAALKSANRAAQQLEQQQPQQATASTRKRANSESRVPKLPLFIRRQQSFKGAPGGQGELAMAPLPSVRTEQPLARAGPPGAQALSSPTFRSAAVPVLPPQKTYREMARALLEDLA